MTRRLIVCFDGTWNTPDKGDEPTNVVKIVRAITNLSPDGQDQIVFYDKGVGTAGGWDRLKGGLTGAGLEENVVDGYRFLANNYEIGDDIFVFGFSRGAYTARSLAGMIGAAGLFHPVSLGRALAAALQIQRSDASRAVKRDTIAKLPGLRRHENVPIACVGVFDTVGSLGIPGKVWSGLARWRYQFNDVELSPRVGVALHALAIDEKRGPFQPTLWKHPPGTRTLPEGQHVEQVWFPGVHSNVGGSYAEHGLSDIALQWMARRVHDLTGLAFDDGYLGEILQPDVTARAYESRTALYTHNRIAPSRREIRAGGSGAETIEERLHVSALERWRAGPVHTDCKDPASERPTPYRPENLGDAIAAAHRGDAIPVVGWDGALQPAASVDWPSL